MKIQVWIILLSLGFSQLAHSQGPEVILVRFEHQTNTPVAYPDYFKDRRWVDSLLNLTKDWLKERYNAEVFDYKQRSPITYLPSIQEDKNIRSIQYTVYDLALSVMSVLESGLGIEKAEDNKGKLRFTIELADKNGRRVFRNYVNLSFNIIRRPEAGEIFMGQRDFRRFYREALQVAFKQKPKSARYIFYQPLESRLQSFMDEAEQGVFIQKDRASFQLYQRQKDTLQNWSLRFTAPYTSKDEYGRSATLDNPFDQKNYTFRGFLKERTFPEVYIDMSESEEYMARFRRSLNLEQTQLEGEWENNAWSLTRNLQSKLVRVRRNGKIIALFFHKNTDNYEVFMAPNLSNKELSQIANLWVAESTAQAVHKYYQVETGQ